MILNSIDTGHTHANILDPDLYTNGVPHSTFKRLRDEERISWWDEKDGSGFWALTRYDDVLKASRLSKVFSSAQGVHLEEMDEEELAARQTMIEMDSPEHTSYRRLQQNLV